MKLYLKKTYKKFIKLIFLVIYGKISIADKNLKSVRKILVKKKFFNNKNYYIYEIKNGVIFTDNVQNVAAKKTIKYIQPHLFNMQKTD